MINLTEVFSLGLMLVMAVAGCLGLWITGVALLDLFVSFSPDKRYTNQQSSFAGAMVRLLVGGALIVAASLLFAAGDTMAGGSERTAALFDYGAPAANAYCDSIRVAATRLFMLVGGIAFVRSLYILHARQGGASAHTTGSPTAYFIFGTLTFFITDLSVALSNTIGMPIGLDNLCKVLQ